VKRFTLGKAFRTFFLIGILYLFSSAVILAQNSISGMIFDDNRKPVQNLEVELLDSLERLIGTRKTRNTGFYTFQRLSRGVYYIRVRVAGTNFKEKKIRIDLGDLNAIGGVDVKQVDVYLEADRRKADQTPVNNTVIFAQNIPPAAKKEYDAGHEKEKKKNTPEALKHFNTAVQIFPEYFDALESLGNGYLEQKEYDEAEKALRRAALVNPKSFRVLFSLAVAQNKLLKKTSAVESLQKANEIDAGSINSHLLLGIIQRDLKKYKEAEKTLLRAKKLGQNKFPDVHWNLALLYYHDLKRYSVAADELNLYLEAIPKDERKNMKQTISQVRKLITIFRKKAKESS
jgi:tetratricopeptide (TPR) repeat protein